VRLRQNSGTGYVDIGTTFADSTGKFTFSVGLSLGPNAFQVLATDAAGNVALSGATIFNNAPPTVAQSIGPVTVPANSGPSTFDLSQVFADENNNEPVVKIDTSLGTIFVQLFEDRAPLHTANFLSYVNSGAYDNALIHRLIPGLVAQSGGFEFLPAGDDGNPNTTNFQTITAGPSVTNEPGLPNSRGTVALAKLPPPSQGGPPNGGPDSGTDEFFFNLADNVGGAPSLDTQNGGFTVFGQVTGNGQQVLDAIAQVPTFDLPEFQGVPLRNNFSGTSFQDATANNVVLFNSITRLADPLTYTVVSNDNPGLVTVTPPAQGGSQLQLAYTQNTTGTANIVIRATDVDGSFVDHSFTVTVTP